MHCCCNNSRSRLLRSIAWHPVDHVECRVPSHTKQLCFICASNSPKDGIILLLLAGAYTRATV